MPEPGPRDDQPLAVARTRYISSPTLPRCTPLHNLNTRAASASSGTSPPTHAEPRPRWPPTGTCTLAGPPPALARTAEATGSGSDPASNLNAAPPSAGRERGPVPAPPSLPRPPSRVHRSSTGVQLEPPPSPAAEPAEARPQCQCLGGHGGSGGPAAVPVPRRPWWSGAWRGQRQQWGACSCRRRSRSRGGSPPVPAPSAPRPPLPPRFVWRVLDVRTQAPSPAASSFWREYTCESGVGLVCCFWTRPGGGGRGWNLHHEAGARDAER
jgi:hypothetical protein